MKKEKSNAAKDSLELLLIVPGKVPAERSPETSTPWAVTMRLLLFSWEFCCCVILLTINHNVNHQPSFAFLSFLVIDGVQVIQH